ncbi:MAG: sulfatase, partial [Planctomycetales bacterium]
MGRTASTGRIPKLSCLASVVALLCCVSVRAVEPERAKPNVLFIAVDDMNDWVNCLGGCEGKTHTPNIDRLAKRGVLFTNAHCPSPKCAPSRAAVMTGLRPSTTGLYDNGHWWLPNLPDAVTLPAHFRDHGYQAVGAGKIFHHTAGNNPPSLWDDYLRLTFRNDPWFRGAKINYPWSKSGPYPRGFPFSRVKGLGHENDWGSLDIPDKDYDDALTADYAARFLKRKHNRPFFLACGLFRPHLPWYVPRRFFDLYPLDEIRLPEIQENDLDVVPAEGKKLAAARAGEFKTIRGAGRWKQAIQAYLASISHADEQVGRLLDALDAGPHSADTIIVFWSDHGWHLGEKGHWHKSTLWEEATRTPLIISGPGVSPSACGRAVSLLDLYPTLNELCGLPVIASHDGVSLLPWLRDPTAPRDRPAVIEFRRGNAAVRSDRYRYIRYRDGGEELYDHQVDPREWNNLAASAEHATVKNDLAKRFPKNWAEPAPTK